VNGEELKRMDKSLSKNELPVQLAKPAQRALNGAGITNLEQLSELTEEDLMKLHGMGPKAMDQLRAAMEEKSLSFANK
jgi:DNA-directed RNA polymerase alpha subunit